MNIFTWITNLFKKPDKTEIDWPGCLPPLTDFRDVLGSVLLQETPLPTSYNIPYRLKVKDQDGRPICVAASSSLAKEERELRENIDIEFDPDWLYAEAKKIDNYPGDGTYLNIPLKIMMNKGIKVLGGSEADVGKFRIGGYLRLDDLTPNGLKRRFTSGG